MKQASANQIKKGMDVATEQLVPREGSFIRAVYDKLLENRGRWIAFKTLHRYRLSTSISQLKDFYGLDIEVRRKGSGGRGAAGNGAKYRLVGEYIGRHYVSFIGD